MTTSMQAGGSWVWGLGIALLVSLIQVVVWLATMSGTTLGTGWVLLLLLMMLVLPASAVAFLCRRKPPVQKGFLISMCVIWLVLIVGAFFVAFLLGSAYQGMGAR